MRTLLTGADGFIGRRLAALLARHGDELFGTARGSPPADPAPVQRLDADLRDESAVLAAVERARPDRVFHLAAFNHIPSSFEQPALVFAVNAIGTVHLLQAVRARAPQAVVLSVGSSAEYGDSARLRDAVSEEDRLLPTSPYGISKVAQGLLCREAFRSHETKVVHVRPFAVVGPGKKGDALTQFAAQVVRVERGEQEALEVGNLESVRDFIDVRDCASALALVAERGTFGETYNVCNGRPVKVLELVEALRRCARRPFEIVQRSSHLRPVDDSRIVGDPKKLVELGYAPRYPLADTVRDTLDSLRSEDLRARA